MSALHIYEVPNSKKTNKNPLNSESVFCASLASTPCTDKKRCRCLKEICIYLDVEPNDPHTDTIAYIKTTGASQKN